MIISKILLYYFIPAMLLLLSILGIITLIYVPGPSSIIIIMSVFPIALFIVDIILMIYFHSKNLL